MIAELPIMWMVLEFLEKVRNPLSGLSVICKEDQSAWRGLPVCQVLPVHWARTTHQQRKREAPTSCGHVGKKLNSKPGSLKINV